MKKKVKLFSTIASLCLAVALMAFGVYAANTATLSLTSSVSYTISGDVNVKFEVSVVYDESYVTYKGDSADSELSTTGDTSEKTISWSKNQEVADNDINKTLNLGEFAFKNVENVQGKTIVYTVKITNLAAYDAKVIVTGGPETTTSGAVTITVSGDTSDVVVKAATAEDDTDVYTYTVTYTLADATKDFATSNFAPKFVVTPNTTE